MSKVLLPVSLGMRMGRGNTQQRTKVLESHKILIFVLDQCCPIGLSVMVEMSCNYAVKYGNPYPHVATRNVASDTEEPNFYI